MASSAQDIQVWNRLHEAFRSSAGSGLQPGTEPYNNAFNAWLGPALGALNINPFTNGDWANLPAFISDPAVSTGNMAGAISAAANGPIGVAQYLINTYGSGIPAGRLGESIAQYVEQVMPGQFELQNDESMESIPLEQALFERVLNDYLLPDLDRDAERRGQAQQSIDAINRSLDEALAINRESIDGRRLQQEYAMADETANRYAASARAEAEERVAAIDEQMAELNAALDRMSQDRTGALDAETEQLRTALGVLESERMAALEDLSAARLSAAEARVSGVNQALESERDRILAADAVKGYVGGSSFTDDALTRAGITATQDAAALVGDAKVANATDRRGVVDQIAQSRFDIEGRDASGRRGIVDETAAGRFELAKSGANARVGIANDAAAGVREAADFGTGARKDYFDNDYPRRLEAAFLPAATEAQRIALIGTADDAGYSGLRRTLNTLDWWAGASNPPTVQPYQQQTSTWGSDIAGLGAGIAGAGINLAIANANKTKTPQTKTPQNNTQLQDPSTFGDVNFNATPWYEDSNIDWTFGGGKY